MLFVFLGFLFLVDYISTFQIDDDLNYVLIRKNFKDKKCHHGLQDPPDKLYSETYVELFKCVTLPPLESREESSETIKVYHGDVNGTEYFTVKSCLNMELCEHSTYFDNTTLGFCVNTRYESNKCHKEEDGTYTTVARYRTIWTPSALFYLPHDYSGVMTGLYTDSTCSKRVGYHFEADKSFSFNSSSSSGHYHKSCFEENIAESKKCRLVDHTNGKTFMKQVCLRSGPFRLNWIWLVLAIFILFTIICCCGSCPCYCSICDRESVKKKVVPEWERTYSFIQDDDETLDAERISINRIKGDMNVKVKRCVLVVRKLMEIWHLITLGIMVLTSVFTVIIYLGTVSIWVFIEYANVETIIVSAIMVFEFLLLCPAGIVSCYFLIPDQVSDRWWGRCLAPYWSGISTSVIFNVYFFVFVLLDMYFFYYAGLLFGNGMVYFESHVWVFTTMFIVKSLSLGFVVVEIVIRCVKILLGLKGIIELISSNIIAITRFIAKTGQKIGILKRDPTYQPI